MDDSIFNPVFKTKTWVGDVADNVTKFALTFVPIAGQLGKLGMAEKIGAAGTNLAAGALTDFLQYNEKQGKLSDLIQKYPALQNPVTEFLQSSPDDNWAEGRFKAAIEGLGLGAVGDLFTASLKGFRGMAAAKASGNLEAAQAAAEGTSKAVTAIMERSKAAAEGAIGGAVQAPSKALPEQAVESLKSALTRETPDEAVKTAYRPWFNQAKLEGTSEAAKDVLDKASQALASSVEQATGGTKSLETMLAEAQTYLSEWVENPGSFWRSLQGDVQGSKDIAARMIAYRAQVGQAAEDVSSIAAKLSASPNDSAVAEELDKAVEWFSNTYALRQELQTELARATTSGNVLIKPAAVDPSRVAEAIDLFKRSGGEDRQVAIKMLEAAADTPTMTMAFDLISQQGSKLWPVAKTFWINALLSGPKTFATNGLMGAMMSLVQPAERFIGGMFSRNPEARNSAINLYGGLIAQAGDVWQVIKKGGDLSESPALSATWKAWSQVQPVVSAALKTETGFKAITAENLGLSPDKWSATVVNWLGKTVGLPSRLLMTTDELLLNVNARSALRDMAMREAEGKGITDPQAFTQYVETYLADAFTPAGMLNNREALEYAQRTTMTTDLAEGTFGRSLQKLAYDHPWMNIFVPFIKVPTNILRTAWQMTPGLNFLQKEFRNNWSSLDPIKQADARGRMVLGSMFWMMAASWASKGGITGSGPSNAAVRQNLLNSGWQPYSFVVNNPDGTKEYISYQRLDAFAPILGIAADWAEAAAHMESGEAEQLAGAMVTSLARNFTNKTYMAGLANLADVMSRPDQEAGSWINKMAGSFVPSLLPNLYQDEYVRETRTALDAIRKRIPGLSDSLPPKRNILGEAIHAPAGWLPMGGAGTYLANAASPLAFSPGSSDQVKQELADLRFGFSHPGMKLHGLDLTQIQNDKDGQDAYDYYLQQHGQVQIGGRTLGDALQRLIQSPRYQAMPKPDQENDSDNPRVKAVQQVIQDYRERALGQTMKQYPQVKQILRQFDQVVRQRSTPNMQILTQLQ